MSLFSRLVQAYFDEAGLTKAIKMSSIGSKRKGLL